MYVVDPCTRRPYKAQYLAQWINTNSSAIGRATTGSPNARAVAVAVYPGMGNLRNKARTLPFVSV
jgi:hypothetical protein